MFIGEPSEANCYADIDCVFEYLTKERNIPPEHIVLYGRSLGSGPSCYLAAKSAAQGRTVAGLVLHSAFASVYRVVIPECMLLCGGGGIGCTRSRTFFGDLFPNVDRMMHVECPIFIAHGREDRIVPYEHGCALLEAAPCRDKAELFSVEGMHHNYYETALVEKAFMTALNRYLDYHVLARRLWMRPNGTKSTRQGRTPSGRTKKKKKKSTRPRLTTAGDGGSG